MPFCAQQLFGTRSEIICRPHDEMSFIVRLTRLVAVWLISRVRPLSADEKPVVCAAEINLNTQPKYTFIRKSLLH
jgi:hypothetical protein